MSELESYQPISRRMRDALEIFEHGTRDTSWFGEQFWPTGSLARDMREYELGTPGCARAQAVLDTMVTAGVVQLHWKRTSEYELTTRGKILLAVSKAGDR